LPFVVHRKGLRYEKFWRANNESYKKLRHWLGIDHFYFCGRVTVTHIFESLFTLNAMVGADVTVKPSAAACSSCLFMLDSSYAQITFDKGACPAVAAIDVSVSESENPKNLTMSVSIH
jgi:hypothetical protein